VIATLRKPAFAGRGVYVVSIFIGLALWEFLARDLPRVILPPPSIVVWRLLEDLANGKLLVALGRSLPALGIGSGLALLVGIPVGLALGRNRTLAAMFDPVVNAIYAVPPVAFVPFLIIWFGLYLWARVALVFLMSIFEIVIAVSAGARDVSQTLVDVGRSFDARGLRLTWTVMLPAMAPFLFLAVRIALVRGINAMITAELFFAAVNLGAMMNDDARRFDTAGLLSVILMLALLGLFTQEALKRIERWALPWHLDR
jgi:ABC-type nitrate/sulfonate/bicarbonate transport system permease component